jgi:hypothetical protein
VLQKQANQFFANVTGRANHGDLGPAAAINSRVRRIFHKAQSVFRFALIATKHCKKILPRDESRPRRFTPPLCTLDG